MRLHPVTNSTFRPLEMIVPLETLIIFLFLPGCKECTVLQHKLPQGRDGLNHEPQASEGLSKGQCSLPVCSYRHSTALFLISII